MTKLQIELLSENATMPKRYKNSNSRYRHLGGKQ